MRYDEFGNPIPGSENEPNGGGEGAGAGNKIAELSAQKEHFREKAAREEEARKNAEAKADAAEKKAAEALEAVNKLSGTVSDTQLMQSMGLDQEALTVLKGIASVSGKQPHEMLEDDRFKTYMEGRSAKVRAAEIVPEPTPRTPVVGDRSYSELGEPEKKANYSGTVEKLIDKGRNTSNRNLR